jgi:hypothetical protein
VDRAMGTGEGAGIGGAAIARSSPHMSRTNGGGRGAAPSRLAASQCWTRSRPIASENDARRIWGAKDVHAQARASCDHRSLFRAWDERGSVLIEIRRGRTQGRTQEERAMVARRWRGGVSL